MAINASVDQNTPAPSPLGGALAWLVLAGGLAAALGWVVVAQKLGDTIVIANIGAAISVYFALLFAPLVALAFLLAALEHRRLALIGRTPRRWIALGGALSLCGLLVSVGYAWLNGEIVRGAAAPSSLWLIALGAVLTLGQVFAEEALFRGWLQTSLIQRVGLWPGLLLGAALFACFHITGGARAPLSLLNLMLGGLFFGLLAHRSGGIAAPFSAHYLWNATEDSLLGLVPNPGNGALGSVFDLDLAGLPIWGGQEEGLNASIGTTLVLLALILPLRRKHGSETQTSRA